MRWTQAVQRIRNGMSVDEAVTNIPINDLVARTDYLKSVLEAFQAGHALTHQDAPLTAATFVGCAVYWSDSDDAYAPAISAYSVSDGGVVVPADTSRVLGVVIEKTSAAAGTVCLLGHIDGVDITAAVGVGPDAGVYYLSSTTAGTLTTTKPPLAIPVLELASITMFWVHSGGQGNPHEHQHYSFELEAWPAGIVDEPAAGDPYTFLEEWDGEVGWLPADSSVFSGMDVPAGAEFGYNLAQDTALADVWPPAPVDNARLYVDGVIQRDARVVINEDGIWWMSNCEGAVPFGSGSSETCLSSSLGCPEDWCETHLLLAFTHIMGMTADAFVTSLQGVAPVEVISCDTLAAAVRGSLQVQLAAYTETDFSAGGAMPSTTVVSVDREAKVNGPLISGARGTGTVVVTGSGTPVVADDGYTYQTGGLLVTSSSSDENREGGVDVVALTDVGETEYQGNLYYRLLQGQDSALRGLVRVPLSYLPTGPEMTLSFWVMGVAAGALPDLGLTYRRLPYSAVAAQTLGTSDTALSDLSPSVTTTVAYQYIVVLSDAFAVAAGDIVFFELSRDSGDAYAADLGILNMRWTIDPA